MFFRDIDKIFSPPEPLRSTLKTPTRDLSTSPAEVLADHEEAHIAKINELEIAKIRELSKIEADKFKQTVDAISAQALKSVAQKPSKLGQEEELQSVPGSYNVPGINVPVGTNKGVTFINVNSFGHAPTAKHNNADSNPHHRLRPVAQLSQCYTGKSRESQALAAHRLCVNSGLRRSGSFAVSDCGLACR